MVNALACFLLIYVFYSLKKEGRVFYSSLLICALVIGCLEVLSQCVVIHDSLERILLQPAYWVEVFLEKSFIFYVIGLLYFKFLNTDYLIYEGKKSQLKKFYDTHLMKIVFIFLLLASIPVFISYYPWGSGTDSQEQYDQFLAMKFANHHPVFSSLWKGSLYYLGAVVFKSHILGVFLNILVQTILICYSIAYMTKIENKHHVRGSYQILSVLFISSVFFWIIVANDTKSFTFTAFFIMYVSLIIDMFLDTENLHKHSFYFLLLSILLCFLRNNGIFAVFPTLFCMIFYFWKKISKKIILLWLSPVFIFYGITMIVYPLCHVLPGSKSEMFSIPFLQTARVVRDYEALLTENEKQAISDVLDYEKIVPNYNLTYLEGTSDALKFPTPAYETHREGTYKIFNQPNENKKLLVYFKYWFLMFFKYPQTYISAMLHHNYHYFSFYRTGYNIEPLHAFYENILSNDKLKYNRIMSALFSGIITRDVLLLQAPYLWILIYSLCFLIIKKKLSLYIPFIPLCSTYLVCILGPCGSWEYLSPVQLSIFIIVPYMCIQAHNLKNKGQVAFKVENKTLEEEKS